MLLTAAIIFTLVEINLRKASSAFEYIAEAERLINIGEYTSAADKCSEGLEKYPNDAELYLKKAQAYLLAGDEEKALGTVEFGYKQTGSGSLSEFREENFPLTISSPEFFETSGNGVFGAPESGGQSDQVKDPQNRTEYTAPYPAESEITVVIPSVAPAPDTHDTSDISVNGGNNSNNSDQITSESENVQ